MKYIVGKTYKPLLVRYLSKTRMYHYKDIVLEIPPQVFHPRFFFSTRLLLNYISKLNLEDKTFLELGAGSGMISIYASKKNAVVTASDINPIAIKTLIKNRVLNGTKFEIIHSDLFTHLPERKFDLIAINPPYYKKRPVNPEDYAWYCGEQGEYFKRLFDGIKKYSHRHSIVLMILCDGCDLAMIECMARENNISLDPVHRSNNLLEENIIYQLAFHHVS